MKKNVMYYVAGVLVAAALVVGVTGCSKDGKNNNQEGAKDTVNQEEVKDVANEEDTKDTFNEEDYFKSMDITDEIFARIKGKSFKDDCTVPVEELKYIKVLHTGFDGETHEGEIIVNTAIADNTAKIFKELYEIKYPIEKIKLIDEYDADDDLSMADNNSSAFNFRFIAGTTTYSNHAKGLAIDINTLYNPYVRTRDGKEQIFPIEGKEYKDRELDCPYYIKKDDECYNIFIKYGFTWGGEWEDRKDYQHFEYKIEE